MANTLKFGNGEWYGKKDTILAYNDENSNYKPLTFDFSRASKATVINKDGLIEQVGSGQPRIDYKDDSKGALKLEPSRTNTIIKSNSVTVMNYGGHITSSDNAAISPDGTFNAMSLIPNTSQNTHRLGYNTTAGTYTQNNIVTFSCFVKADGYNFVSIGGFFGGEQAVFNISNGTFVSQNSSVINTKIVKLPNDWYRLSTTYTFQNSIGNGYLYAGIQVMDSETGYAFTGDGVKGVYAYGIQAEVGSYPTSYIPTQGSTVTRLADSCANGGNEQVINSTEGVLYTEISTLANDGARGISISSGSNNDRIFISYNTNGRLDANVRSGGSYQAIFNYTGVVNPNIQNKIALKYKLNDFALWVNGVEVATDSSGITPIGLNVLNFSTAISSSDKWYGKVKDVRVYNTALSDQELISLTQV